MATSGGAKAGLADRVGTAVEAADAPKPPTLAQLIDRQKDQVQRALPAHLKASAEAYIRAAQTLVKNTPGLAKCDAMTVLGGLMTASQMGLELGPLGKAYLVPYGNKAQLIIGYRGLIDLAWRSGQLKSIEAREVCANDTFDFAYGLEPKLEHRVNLEGERGHVIAFYGVAHFKDGGHYFLVMSKADVEKHRKRSKAKDSGPWITDYDAMGRKTVIRAMAPFLPLTIEVMRDMALDGSVSTGAALDNLTVEEQAPEDDGIVDAEVVADGNGEIVDDGSFPIEPPPDD